MIKGNRPLNILLILCLIIIWFFVIKKAFFQKSEVPTLENTSIGHKDVGESISTRKKVIVLSELRNPFFFDRKYPKKRAIVIYPIQRTTTSKTKKIITWPALEYYGYVGRNSEENLRGLLKINKKMVRMKIGDKLQDLKLKKLYPDSIVVLFDNKLKTINRSQ